MRTPCTKDIVLLAKEQLRHDKLLSQLTSMLTDLIKVNLQREIPNGGGGGSSNHQLDSQKYAQAAAT